MRGVPSCWRRDLLLTARCVSWSPLMALHMLKLPWCQPRLASALATPARGELNLTRVVSSRPQQVSDEEVGKTEQYLRSVVERLQHAP